MAKVIITEELTQLLKSLRIENGISAKALAEHINKSASYITKLEKGEIQSIHGDALFNILKFLLGEKSNPDEIIESVFRTLNYKYTTKEIENQVWFHNFDTVIRKIPVPEAFCTDTLEMLTANQISIDYLVERINQNEFIPDKSFCDIKTYPVNQWFECKFNGVSETYILLELDKVRIASLLNRKTSISNYVTLLAIIMYSLRLINYSIDAIIDKATIRDLQELAQSYLQRYKILTLTEKQARIEKALTKAERELQLSSYDVENLKVKDEFIELLDVYSEFNIKTANKSIASINKNMEWDAPFIMRIASIPFRELEPCSGTMKHAIISEIEQVFQKYKEIPSDKRKIEEY